jgi:predicted DNA repair protein MutK
LKTFKNKEKIMERPQYRKHSEKKSQRKPLLTGRIMQHIVPTFPFQSLKTPEIAEDLSARASLVQLSLTACLIGLTIGQVVVGPRQIHIYIERPQYRKHSEKKSQRKPLLTGRIMQHCPAQFNRMSDRTDNRTGCCRPVK